VLPKKLKDLLQFNHEYSIDELITN
jgi:hypothetical protein